MNGVALLVSAVGALAARGAAEHIGRVEVQRHLAHSRGCKGVALNLGQRLVELPDVAEGETPKPRPRRLGRRDGKTTQLRLGHVATGDGKVIETTSAKRHRLRDGHHELGL